MLMLYKISLHRKLFFLVFTLLVVLPVSACADVPIDEAHFPDPAFRSFLHCGYVNNTSNPIHENLSDYELALESLPDDWILWYRRGDFLTP